MGKSWANRPKLPEKAGKRGPKICLFLSKNCPDGQKIAINDGQIFIYLRNPMGKSWANFHFWAKRKSYDRS